MMKNRLNCLVFFLVFFSCLVASSIAANPALFSQQTFTEQDSVLVVQEDGQVLYSWNADKLLIPASLSKLVTALLAIEKWGVNESFTTDFYLHGKGLWVKAYGDPYLVSEELLVLSQKLDQRLTQLAFEPEFIAIDNSFFAVQFSPGRSTAVDPYNAPLSSVSANFNTIFLEKSKTGLRSAESQTPLTPMGVSLSGSMRESKERVNLISADNAQIYFAELLREFTNLSGATIKINSLVPEGAQLIYRHNNSNDLSVALKGMMIYSNNFIANQLVLMLAAELHGAPATAGKVALVLGERLAAGFGWQSFHLEDGAGLSRDNRLSPAQLVEVLERFRTYYSFKYTHHNRCFLINNCPV